MIIEYNPTYTYCNYRCEYCCVDSSHGNENLDSERYFKIIDKICELPHPVDIVRVAVKGEPFLSKLLIEGMVKLANCKKIGAVNTVTNLSMKKETLIEFLNKVDPDKFSPAVSLHHTQIKDFDLFIENIKILKERKILFIVGCIAYPPYLEQIKLYKKYFEEELGVPFFTNVYHGKYGWLPYPRCYSFTEKRILRNLCFSDFEYYYQMELKKSKGKLCTAGKDLINIEDNGLIYRCLTDRTCLGSILEDEINIFKEYKPCEVDHCSCVAMLVNLFECREKFGMSKNFRIYFPKKLA